MRIPPSDSFFGNGFTQPEPEQTEDIPQGRLVFRIEFKMNQDGMGALQGRALSDGFFKNLAVAAATLIQKMALEGDPYVVITHQGEIAPAVPITVQAFMEDDK